MHVLNQTEFDELVVSGTILEVVSKVGPKVIQLPKGEFLKLFRVKSLLSKYRVINPGKRFSDNALKLQKRGIATLKVKACYSVPHLKSWGVLYQGLEGVSLRSLVEQGGLDEALLTKLVSFIALLHEQGVYFRSLHFGNIILTPSGELGLIDFLDCHFKRKLYPFQRRRNFAHLFRYAEAKPFEKEIARQYAQRLYPS